ncbi:MAG: extracellular solute-binding protein [Oscillospiraceae bacterium]|nr:extracellular solute-binding protein [Oscillospiraceae bacterium]
MFRKELKTASKKALLVSLSIVLVAAMLAGCGGGGQTAGTTSVAQTAATTAAQEVTTAAAQDATTAAQQDATTAAQTEPPATAAQTEPPATITDLSFFHWKGEERDTWAKIIEMFENENPNIRVHMEILPEDQYYTTLQARVMAGEGLDVFMVNPGSRFATFLRADAFMDLTGQPFLDELSPVYLSSGQANGKQYIIPLSKSFVGFFYNKTVFSDLGLTVPETWDDFLAVCEAIKQSGMDVVSTGMADSFTSTWPWIESLVQYTDDLDLYPKLARGDMKFTDEVFYNTLAPLQEMATKGYWQSNASGTKYDTSITLFATGRAAMHNNGTWAIGAIRQANPDLDFSIFVPPFPNGQHVAGVAPAQAPCVFSKTKNVDESLKFMSYIFSKDIMEIYGNETGQEVTNVNSVLTDSQMMEMAAIGNSGQIYPHYFSLWSQIDQDIVSEITTRAMLGEDLDEILRDGQTRLESLNIEVED